MTTKTAVETTAPQILVVEDDPDIQLLISRSLGNAGFDVRTANDGRDALSRIDEALPDLIVSDVMMPEMDGLELLSVVRNDPVTRRIPLILLTARGSSADIVGGLDLGADDYLPKPFVVSELQARVRAKVARPPVPADELHRQLRSRVLPAAAFAEELERELSRTKRGGGAGCLAYVEFSELDRVRERLGARVMESVLNQVGQAIAEDGRSLDSVGCDDQKRFMILLPETGPGGAEIRLRRLHQLIVKQAFAAGTETVRLTPMSGYLPYDRESTVDQLQNLALTALDHAAIRLDLEPIRYGPSMGTRDAVSDVAVDTRRTHVVRRDKLRLVTQIAGVHLAGILTPLLFYVGMEALFGINVVPVVYLLVVLALVVTAGLIWIEGYEALKIRIPPEPDAEPPPVTAIIAAYLPNEAATVVDTIEAFLRIAYPGKCEVILAYNTPRPLPVELTLRAIAERDVRFRAIRVPGSTSKAQNVNAALTEAAGEIIGVFDADHHPAPDAFTRAWRWIASGYDIVQGHCVVRNGDESRLSRSIAVEFEAIYAVSHPGRAQLHQFGIFGGSNGYWRADLLRKTRMHGFMLTEDIDSSIRAVNAGYRIMSDPELISEELAPVTFTAFWNQRMRWAQGWFQVSRKHLIPAMRSQRLTRRQKAGMFHLLGWREIYPWLSLQMWPVIGFWIWSYGSITEINWLVPIFLLTTLMTLSVGPGQVLFAYMLGAPQIRKHRSWFIWYLVTAPVFTELKNVISRVAQVKEFMGERQWKVTPRGGDDPFAYDDEPADDDAERNVVVTSAAPQLDDEVVPEVPPAWTLFDADLEHLTALAGDASVTLLDGLVVSDGTAGDLTILTPYVPMVDRYAVEAEIRMMLPDRYGGSVMLLAGVEPITPDRHSAGVSGGFDTAGRGRTVLQSNRRVIREAPVGVDSEWHTVRLEVSDGVIRLLVDDVLICEQDVGQFAGIGNVGLTSRSSAWRLRALRVVSL